MRHLTYLYILVQVATASTANVRPRQTNSTDVLKFIDPLIGSQNGGNVFSGATLPYGMAKGMNLMTVSVTICS
jgi:putative alpha-1,2-mannosidase